jgi:hypothetical protein
MEHRFIAGQNGIHHRRILVPGRVVATDRGASAGAEAESPASERSAPRCRAQSQSHAARPVPVPALLHRSTHGAGHFCRSSAKLASLIARVCNAPAIRREDRGRLERRALDDWKWLERARDFISTEVCAWLKSHQFLG